MVALVTLAEAKDHLRVTGDDDDADITLKVGMATDIVIDYIEKPAHGWDATTAPPLIKAAILLVLSPLYDDSEGDPLSDPVRRILHRQRDPALA